jgi:acyl-coenzyme A synthetase/AMP-(fatty) acid ligase
MNEVDEETVIPYDKTEKHDKIVKKEFRIQNELISEMNDIESDVFFLSAIMFTLTKFIYNKEILITKLIKTKLIKNNNTNEFIKTIATKNINTNINVKDYLNEINQLISKNNEYEAYFNELTKTNDLTFPDFQYYYQKEDEEDLTIPESNFTIIIKENLKENVREIQFIYNNALYSEKLMKLFYNSLIIIINKFINNQNLLLKNISITEDHEFKFKKTGIKSLKEFFENIVKDNEDKTALIANDKTLNYNELNQEANKLANSLIDNGLSVGDRVIINLNRDSNFIISIIAVIKAGGVFIITNPNDPIERNNYFKENSKAKTTIDQNNINTLIKNTNTNNPKTELSSNDSLAIVYTSGSTGKPKGVILTHENMINRLFYNNKNFIYDIINLNVNSLLLSMNAIFIGFIINLFIALYAGRIIVFCDEELNKNPMELYDLFKKTRFDLMVTVPSAIEAYLKIEPLKELISNLKILGIAGEKSTNKFIEKIKKYTSANIYNIYGSTEVVAISNLKLLNDDINSVGKPQYNVDEKITDIDGNPIPAGIIGELWIGGPGTSKGYLNNPKLTEKSFTEINGYNYFKSGDFAKFNENFEVEIIGRIDNQVKLRGQRIELSEIENNIPNDIGVEKVIAIIQKINKEQYLTLYFTTTKDLDDDKIDEIKEKIKVELFKKLPNFMIPQFYIHLKEFPLTQNGKINVKDLPLIEFKLDEIESPKTDIEMKIFEICSEILGHSKFGVTNSLVSIGFTSLSIIKLSNKILKKYPIEIKIVDLMNSDIRTLSKKIKKSSKTVYTKNKLREYYPLSPQQLSYYYNIKEENFSTIKFNNHAAISLENFDPIKLKNALLKAIEINPDMKIFFIIHDNKIKQKRMDDLEINIPVYNTEVNIYNLEVPNFNIFHPPLFDFRIYYYENNTTLFVSFNHIIFDAVSIENFFIEVSKIYSGEDISKKEFNYFDYILDLENFEKENNIKVKSYLDSKTKNSTLKSYFNLIPKKQISETNYFNFKLSNSQNIEYFSKKFNISQNTIVLSLVVLALKEIFKKDKIYLEYIFNGRDKNIYYDIFGLFRRHFPIFIYINPQYTVIEYLKEIISNMDMAINILPSNDFEKIMRLAKKNSLRIIYDFTDEINIDSSINSKEKNQLSNSHNFQIIVDNNVNTSKNELFIRCIKKEDQLALSFSYDSAFFSKSDIEKICDIINSYSLLIVNNPLKHLKNLKI